MIGLAAGANGQPFTYSLDDGSMEAMLSVVPRMTVLNQFVIREQDRTINEINIVWQNRDGYAAQVVLWRDPNNDGLPHDAEVVRRVDTISSSNRSWAGVTYRFEDAEFEIGDVFYVGVYMSRTTQGNVIFGWAPIDLSRNHQKSWVSFGDDVNDLSSAERLDVRYPRLKGAFLIRAGGGAVPEPATLLALAGGLAAFAARRRR
jgi:hypothetical protein